LNVLLITSSYSPVIGGLQKAVSQLAAGLKVWGHNVAVVANLHPPKLKSNESIEEIPVTRMLFIGFSDGPANGS